MDLPLWAYIIFAITGAAGFISVMWFSFFCWQNRKVKRFYKNVNYFI